MCAQFLNSKILRSLEKPPKLLTYNGIKDLDEHIEHMDDLLDYDQAHEVVKCKLFALTLIDQPWLGLRPSLMGT